MTIATALAEYDALGEPRCGTDDDAATATWLRNAARAAGAEAWFEEWELDRILPGQAELALAEGVIPGLPLFDAPPGNVTGTLGPIGSTAEIGWLRVDPGGASLPGQEIARLRAETTHKALVLATGSGSLAPLNAPRFPDSFGPPVLQVAGEAAAHLAKGGHATLHSRYDWQAATSTNVQATVPGAPEWLVLTPRTSWFTCTAERGGGIAIWLDLLRRGAAGHFLASGGHELGHLGLKHALRHGMLKAPIVLHLGANLGCAGSATLHVRSHDPVLARRLGALLVAVGYPEQSLNIAPPGPVNGEAHELAAAGIPFASLIGSNPLFHSREDRLANTDATRAGLIAEACAGLMAG